MKNYKQILEAVNRGIHFALDDFDDQEEIQGQTNSKVKNNSNLKEYIKLLSVAVDMGLPSGTWWFKYNLGVNPDSPTFKEYFPSSWYGTYYGWGEKAPRQCGLLYSWTHYTLAKGYEKSLTKYCSHMDYGYDMEPETDNFLARYTDKLTTLLPEDDIVTLTFGKGYHIPTKEQWEELIENTTLEVIDNYQGIHDSRAFVLISKINGNKIYIPASGYKNDFGFNGTKHSACLWSSTLYTPIPSNAWRYAFRGTGIGKGTGNLSQCERSDGFAIRPVYNEK